MASYEREISAAVARLALAGDGALLGFTLAIFALQTWSKFRSSSSALTKIRQARAFRISDLRSLFSESDENQAEGGKLVVVRGQVQAKSTVDGNSKVPLFSQDSGEKAVVILSTQTCLYNEWRGIFGWNFDWRALLGRSLKEQLTTSFRMVPFVLVEDGNWLCSDYVIVNLENSRHSLPLTTVYHQLRPIQATPFTFLQAIFGHGYPVGILDEEKILPPGKEITAVGHCNLQCGVPEIRSCEWLPYFLSDLTKDQLVADLALQTRFLFWGGILLSTLSVGILSYSFIRNRSKWQEWRSWRQAQQQRSSTPEMTENEETGDVPDGQLCIICLMRRKRSAFLPCGHLVCCARCAALVEHDAIPRCPLCRQDIQSSIRIYDS
ncbi:hypothetical protein AMTRI_Chr04g242890 [Amborella trichopoda]|uniref:RING-type E3 ubiquitin transferase n=1 Tax=Amborella trichopoda TaxID=13333 RepID=W1PMM8_AMBTC|nr:E3 ubiquitin-protein ligase SPL2 [Amborella trichopoda]XP_020526200.1 E3 ubiquitin-protein ligase SPL2 [Amborella trichopoda]ERN11262.1 hypothetical protein AMTR_s00024p00236060 [Amborella trichopoda]|eukprot:XP_011625309.1 E3 ubiquitin-protein ligase SPL2 [Amborella trichopoda]